MKIKRVEIVGFKSFVDKVSLDFQDGITAVLGPNGCGKSNIVDAIRWAMGEQNAKNLRGRSMEDVIFGGSESRKPLGMAEVSMIFSNADGLAPPAFREYGEIMVTRRLYRNGESEYLLNKTPCRLLDISELFMDTGVGARAYSIIEQGKIGMILNAKPEDRRFLIEEAAGVTKYKSRKKSALRKIEATRQNLLRLGDIVSEVRRQLGSLKRQAQKAQRFREYREELRGIEIRFAREKYLKLRESAERVAEREGKEQEVLEELNGRIQAEELRMEELRLLQISREKDVSRGQEQIFHLTTEIQKVEGRIELNGRELENLDRQRERMAAEGEDFVRRLAELDREEKAVAESRSSMGGELESEIRRLAEGEGTLEELSVREQDLNSRLEATRAELYRLLTELSRLGSFQEEAQRRLDSLEERAARNRNEAVVAREKIEEAEGLIRSLHSTLQNFRDRRAGLQQEREELQERLRILRRGLEENENSLLVGREELNRFRSRLESLRQLERDREGYGTGVRALLAEPSFKDGFSRLVADVLEVPARYEAAVEAVLGERLQAPLASDGAEALRALEFLRSQEGRCTLLLSGFATPLSSPVPGAIPLAEVVQVQREGGAAVRGLLEGFFLVEDLTSFLPEGPPFGVALVTEAGDILTWRGEMTGGGRASLDQGLLHKKRETKELSEQVEVLTAQVEEQQEHRSRLREELNESEERLRETEAALHRKDLKVVDSEKDLNRLQEDRGRLQERLEILSLEEDQLIEEREILERQATDAALGRREREGEKAGKEALLAGLQEELMVLRRETEVVREAVTALKVAVASIREREEASRLQVERLSRMREELRGRLESLKNLQEEGEEKKDRLRAEMERFRVELDLLIRRRDEEKTRFEKIREAFDAGAAGTGEQEELLKELRTRAARSRDVLAEEQVRGRELEMESEHLRQTILERYRIDLGEWESEDGEPLDRERGERRLAELRKMIDEMGEVNLTAIEEYQELEERYQFLSTQQEDLRASLEGLQTAISKINRTTRKRFRETFDQVNIKFQEIFPRLFRGGKAELRLTDEEDLLETGIDIIVQPPGKKLQSVNLLSGGEKALTAVALIFSIFLIKPSPFCMLDEVDAPLDDANIGRFNEMVKEMSDISQFIIITHNKRTMEIADTLYGVTMEEPGVSKLVSVRINDLQGGHAI